MDCMIRTPTVRSFILAAAWLVATAHATVCEAALAIVAVPAAHGCCGPRAAPGTPTPRQQPDCGDCPACATASEPEVVALKAAASPLPLVPFLPAVVALPAPASALCPESVTFREGAPPSLARVACLTHAPNAPPAPA